MLHYLKVVCVFFFKQKTAYEMRISDWSSDVCSSDLFEDQFVMDQVKMLLQVHDELVFELPEGDIEAASGVIRQVMESAAEPAIKLSVPLGVEIGRASCRERVCQYV